MSDLGKLFAEWLTALATGLAAVAAFFGWRVQQSISKREARRIVLDVYERLFSRDKCLEIIRKIEKEHDSRRFWKRLCENPSRDELDEIDLDEYLGYFEMSDTLKC